MGQASPERETPLSARSCGVSGARSSLSYLGWGAQRQFTESIRARRQGGPGAHWAFDIGVIFVLRDGGWLRLAVGFRPPRKL